MSAKEKRLRYGSATANLPLSTWKDHYMTDDTPGASPKACPILFSAPMIRALLEGRKTQTRRIVKPQPFAPVHQNCVTNEWGQCWYDRDGATGEPLREVWKPLRSPYGKLGDLLWVREAFRPFTCTLSPGCMIEYNATRSDRSDIKWRPSIHMPRWASRLTLELTEVRVQRLQEISEADAVAEGLIAETAPNGHITYQIPGELCAQTPVRAYRLLWESINGEEAWERNDWIWALSFRVYQQNVDALLKQRAAA